jgi:hypothetical protein
MSRGTPEQDLDTYMDNIDQQEAENRQEEQAAFDTAWEIHKFCHQANHILSSNHKSDMEVIHRTDEHVVTINIYMSEVESEEFKEYIRNHGSKFVRQNYWEVED